MSKLVVTFLVPCFNYARYLGECITSIVGQTFIDFEILILDDASTDETPQVAQALMQTDSRIRYHRHEQNIGHLNNYNFGIQHAQGELIWLISADDTLASPHVLQDFVTQFILHPNIGFAFCRVQCQDEHSAPYEKYIPALQNSDLPHQPTLYPGRLFFQQLLRANFVPAPSTIARKACYEQYGLFHPELTHSGDWYNWLLFSLDWDVYFDPMPKVYYRKHPQNMHQTYEKPRHALENSLLCYQAVEQFLKVYQYPPLLQKKARFAKLQFMHKNDFPLSLSEKLTRLWGKWTG